MKTKLTKEILIDELGFTLIPSLIQESYEFVLEDLKIPPTFVGDNELYVYRSISVSLCNDKGQGEYYLFIRDGNTNLRHKDNIVSITRNLQFKEDLEDFIKVCKL